MKSRPKGHPAGAVNAPLMHFGAGGMATNGDFLPVMAAAFPKDAKLVVGCKTGGRSQRAAMMLEGAGFTDLVEMRGGWAGEADPMGRILQELRTPEVHSGRIADVEPTAVVERGHDRPLDQRRPRHELDLEPLGDLERSLPRLVAHEHARDKKRAPHP